MLVETAASRKAILEQSRKPARSTISNDQVVAQFDTAAVAKASVAAVVKATVVAVVKATIAAVADLGMSNSSRAGSRIGNHSAAAEMTYCRNSDRDTICIILLPLLPLPFRLLACLHSISGRVHP